MVGWVVGLSAQWVVWPSQLMVVLVYGGLWAGGVGGWAVVVVVVVLLGVVVLVVVVPGVVLGVVVVVVVVEIVLVVVLWARPQGSPRVPVGRGGQASFAAFGAA